MQSPINIVAPVPGNKGPTSPNFKIDYKFERNVPLVITNNGMEVVIKFTQFAGAFKITYGSDGTMLSFHPSFISFRFPAEHLINGFRYDGEIILNCDEITPKNNKAYSVTNGLQFVIPIQFHPNAPEYKEFIDLNQDMWRHELGGEDEDEEGEEKIYRPKDPLTGKFVNFDLNGLMTKVMNLKADFSMYMGTQTTPPCLDHVMQIVVNRPLAMKNCQFKDIRENTLLSKSAKETHARQTQFNLHGGETRIKNIKFAQFNGLTNLHDLFPERRIASITIPRVGLPNQSGKPGKPNSKATTSIKQKITLFKGKKGCQLQGTIQQPGLNIK
jgi:carbonic anhydrase